MSFQSETNLTNRVVKAQEELKKLKATQIIGGEGMGYYEYRLDGGAYNLANRNYWGFFIFFAAISEFPLLSVEYELYENGNRVMNPFGGAPIPYDGAKNSLCVYTGYERETIGPAIWVGKIDYKVNGRIISTEDPSCGIWALEMSNQSGSTVKIEIKNIKIRSTLPGVAYCRYQDFYGEE